MPQTVTLRLITAGSTTGPFDLYSNVDGFTTPFEEGVSRVALLSGYTSELVPDGATVVRIQSDGTYCTNATDVYIGSATTSTTSTTTSTTSTTTTAPPTTTSTTSTTTTAEPTTTTTSTSTTTTTAAPTTTTTSTTSTTTSTTSTTTTAAPTTTTTSTTTTTTTLLQIFYGIAPCGSSWDGNTYTQQVSVGTFSSGDIVFNTASGIFYVVQSSSSTNPGLVNNITVQSTGLLTCPSSTTTTTSTTSTTTTAAPTTTTTSTTSTTTSTTSTTTTSTTTTTTTLAPSSALFGRGSSLGTACSSLASSPVTYFWPNGVTFGTGVTLYRNAGLTLPVTGYTFIAHEPSTIVYNIGSGNGLVGSVAGAC